MHNIPQTREQIVGLAAVVSELCRLTHVNTDGYEINRQIRGLVVLRISALTVDFETNFCLDGTPTWINVVSDETAGVREPMTAASGSRARVRLL